MSNPRDEIGGERRFCILPPESDCDKSIQRCYEVCEYERGEDVEQDEICFRYFCDEVVHCVVSARGVLLQLLLSFVMRFYQYLSSLRPSETSHCLYGDHVLIQQVASCKADS